MNESILIDRYRINEDKAMRNTKFCPNCGSENSIVVVNKSKTIEIKGVPIPVDYTVKHCENCGIEFKSLDETFDVINRARQLYREKNNIPSPEDIRAFMDKYNFSLRDMEKLTGIAFKTIDRYLKGAIPDPSNAKFLAMLLQFPEVVLSLMKRETHFSARKFKNIQELLEKEVDEHHSRNCSNCRAKAEFTTRFLQVNRLQFSLPRREPIASFDYIHIRASLTENFLKKQFKFHASGFYSSFSNRLFSERSEETGNWYLNCTDDEENNEEFEKVLYAS